MLKAILPLFTAKLLHIMLSDRIHYVCCGVMSNEYELAFFVVVCRLSVLQATGTCKASIIVAMLIAG